MTLDLELTLGLSFVFLIIVFLSFLGLAFIHTLFTYTIALFYLRQEITWQHPTTLGHIIISILFESSVYFINFLGKPLRKITLTTQQTSHLPVIILVHGFSQSRAYWMLFHKNLQRAYQGRIYSCDFQDSNFPIKDLATELARYIQTHNLTTTPLILIGHSMGGLVSSYYAEYLAQPKKILKVITIGSPLHGTVLTKLAKAASVDDMQINSTFLKDLREKIRNSSHAYYHIASQIDNIVVPWHSALLEHPTHINKVLHYHGHQSLLASPYVLNTVCQWLNDNSGQKSA